MRLVVLFMLFFAVLSANAQQHSSFRGFESEYYKTHEFTDSLILPEIPDRNQNCTLEKRVFGWHPYWVGSIYQNYQWNLLSDLCYFSYEFNASTGNPTNTHSWFTAPVIDTALAHGTKVHLCVTMFSSVDHTTFFGSTTAQTNLITNLVNAVETRNAHGINLDFEGVSSSHEPALTVFVQRIADSLHTRIPGAELTIAMPAVDWGGTWNISALNSYVDLFIFMGYDYYYGGSSIAGPTGPTYTYNTFNYNISRTISYYLHEGMTPSKLLVGVPYYGFEWQTSGLTNPASTVSSGTARTYSTVMNNSSGHYSLANYGWEPNSLESYWAYSSGGLYYQCWVDNERAMSRKFDLINIRDIGGIGIWALGYDNGYTQFWDLIADKFSDCAVVPCVDTIWDLGGPGHSHHNYEDFVYTIEPDNASGLTLDFQSFDLEANYDSLYIYDGPDISSPLIGGYSGTTSPGTIIATGNSLTLRFFSDVSTAGQGWEAYWSCSSDNAAPYTEIQSISNWKTEDFQVVFNDSDNVALEESFWQVLNYNGTDWKANTNCRFLNENFENAVMPSEWTAEIGTWVLNNGHLYQTDSTLSNTKYNIEVLQDSNNVYLYHWQMNLGSADVNNNRRAGLHYFCDSLQLSNRGNNYMVYCRLDDQAVQMYEYINNSYNMMVSASYPFVQNTWYDIKVLYNPNTGYNATWINNEFITSWTDATPLKSGNGFSLRTGNTTAWYDDIKIYTSRTGNESVTVGADSMNMVRWQNPNPSTPACRVKSIVLDEANLWSNIDGEDVNIDYTPPSAPAWVNDFGGVSMMDWDTLYITANTNNYTTCSAASDTNSAIGSYYFGMGSYCLDSAATYYASGDTIETAGIFDAMFSQAIYYTFAYAVNGAGLHSDTVCSDGILVLLYSSVNDNEEDISVYPNPVSDMLTINLPETINADINIYAADGRLMMCIPKNPESKYKVSCGHWPAGIYMIHVNSDIPVFEKFMKD
ncbi:MAG: hypothetical protein C0592_10600 [Marinilabiliales bacterium]|nr:MAG: hypothetical protein C0592_10600 [Marinilabiliales bacterium]